MDNLEKMDLAEIPDFGLRNINGGSCDKHNQCNPESAAEAGEDVRNALILGLAIAAFL